MKLIKACAALGLLSLASLAQASVTLNFDNLTDDTAVGSAYFAAYGITFGPNALAVGSRDVNPSFSGSFKNTPSSPMAVALFDERLPTRASFLINVRDGFDSEFALSYLNVLENSGSYSAEVFDGVDGSGNTLGTIDMVKLSQENCGALACNWGLDLSTKFSGRAYSVLISGTNGNLFVDNLRFGAQATPPGGDVPEPASLALALAGFGAAVLGTRRRRQGQSA